MYIKDLKYSSIVVYVLKYSLVSLFFNYNWISYAYDCCIYCMSLLLFYSFVSKIGCMLCDNMCKTPHYIAYESANENKIFPC